MSYKCFTLTFKSIYNKSSCISSLSYLDCYFCSDYNSIVYRCVIVCHYKNESVPLLHPPFSNLRLTFSTLYKPK